MYIPPRFAEIAPEQIKSIIDTAPLACIVAQAGGELIANHIPLLSDNDCFTLVGHVALANDMHRLVDEGQEASRYFKGKTLTSRRIPTRASQSITSTYPLGTTKWFTSTAASASSMTNKQNAPPWVF